MGELFCELQTQPEIAADGGLAPGIESHPGRRFLQLGDGLLRSLQVAAFEHECQLDHQGFGRLLAGTQLGGALHQKVALAITPVGVGQHLQGAEGVAHRGLDGLEQGAAKAGLLDCRSQQGAQADHFGEQARVALGQPGSLQNVGREVGMVEPVRLQQGVVHLQPPVAVGALGVDAAKQQRQ